MFTFALCSMAVVAASAAAVVVWFAVGPSNAVSGALLGDVLAGLRTAKSLELRVIKDGHAAEVLVAAPGSVRYDDSPHNYRIATGSRCGESMKRPTPAPQAILLGSAIPKNRSIS